MITLVSILLASVLAADNIDTVFGEYVEHSDADANQNYTVSLSLARSGGDIAVRVSVLWNPGVSCEIDTTVPQSAVTTTIDDNGAATYALTANFEDSFLNTGTLSLKVVGDTCILTLSPREVVNTAAARQYDTYTLTRKTSL